MSISEKCLEGHKRYWRERRAAKGTPDSKPLEKKEPARVPPSEIRWVAEQLEAQKADEIPRTVKPPSKAAANLLAKCRSSDKMEMQFWTKFMAIATAEAAKKTEAKKMEDDQRESFTLIEMWKREMPGYLERKALHDAAQAQEAEKRRERAKRLAEFQSGGGKAETEAEAPLASEDGRSEAADAGDDGIAGEGSPPGCREEARPETESPAESEAPADGRGLAAETQRMAG